MKQFLLICVLLSASFVCASCGNQEPPGQQTPTQISSPSQPHAAQQQLPGRSQQSIMPQLIIPQPLADAAPLQSQGPLTNRKITQELFDSLGRLAKQFYSSVVDPLSSTDYTAALDSPYFLRAYAAMLGNVMGDALGQPVEFHAFRVQTVQNFREQKRRGEIPPLIMRNTGSFGLPAGCHTDDASQMFLLAEALRSPDTTGGEFDYSYFRWLMQQWLSHGLFAHLWESGYTAHVSVGLGGNTRLAVNLFGSDERQHRDVTSAAPTDGNGTIMRAAPVAVFLHHDLGLAIKMAAKQAAVTHSGPVAIEMAKLQTFITVKGIQNGGGRAALMRVLNSLETEYRPYLEGEYSLPAIFPSTVFSAELLQNARLLVMQLIQSEEVVLTSPAQSCTVRNLMDVPTRYPENLNWKSNAMPIANPTHQSNAGYYGAYSLDAMTISLYALYHTQTFEELMEYVVHLQGDADTNAAIAAQMAAPFYADHNLVWTPARWEQGLAPHILEDTQWYAFHLYHKGAALR